MLYEHYTTFLRMIKRIVSFFSISILLVCICAVAIYFINPFGVRVDNIRPRLFGMDIYRIPSKSMQPLLFPGDYILVSNTAYLDASPKVKDVVIFNQAKIKSAEGASFIKRIVAISGDTVELKNGVFWLNNKVVEEGYIASNNNRTEYSQNMKLMTVPENYVFVLGDNRDNSSDSRVFGLILEDKIIAKAKTIVYGSNNRSGNKIK